MQLTYSNTTQHPATPYSKAAASTYIITGTEPDAEGYLPAIKIHTGYSNRAKGLTTTAHTVQHKPGSECTMVFRNGMTLLHSQPAARITPKLVEQVHAAALAKWTPSQIVAAVMDKLAKEEA